MTYDSNLKQLKAFSLQQVKNKGTWLGSAIPMPLFIIIFQTRTPYTGAPYLGSRLKPY